MVGAQVAGERGATCETLTTEAAAREPDPREPAKTPACDTPCAVTVPSLVPHAAPAVPSLAPSRARARDVLVVAAAPDVECAVCDRSADPVPDAPVAAVASGARVDRSTLVLEVGSRARASQLQYRLNSRYLVPISDIYILETSRRFEFCSQGRYETRAGFAGDARPRITPSVVGTVKRTAGVGPAEIYGDCALRRRRAHSNVSESGKCQSIWAKRASVAPHVVSRARATFIQIPEVGVGGGVLGRSPTVTRFSTHQLGKMERLRGAPPLPRPIRDISERQWFFFFQVLDSWKCHLKM